MTKRYRWHAVMDRLDKNKTVFIAEIGVWKGGFSHEILKAMPNVSIIQVDRWKPYSEIEKEAEGNSRMSRYGEKRFELAKAENLEINKPYMDRLAILEMDSVKAAKHIKELSLDLVFIDAAHSYGGCSCDIIAWLSEIKDGGWISGHDYHRNGVYKAANDYFSGYIEEDANKTWFVRV